MTWVPVPNPTPTLLEAACRNQVPGTMRFENAEGITTLGDLGLAGRLAMGSEYAARAVQRFGPCSDSDARAC